MIGWFVGIAKELVSAFLNAVPRLRRAAPAAGAAGSAACAAGGFARPSVADHAADQQRHDQREDGDKHDVDEICGKPGQHRITSLKMWRRCEAGGL